MYINHKKSPSAAKGFTLTEMLVVIAILGSLAAISFPLVRGVINKGKIQETKARMAEFETAVNDFNNDTGHLPFSGSDYPSGDKTLSGEELRQVVRILLNQDYQNTDKDGGNDLGKKYLLMPDAKNGRNGVTYYNDKHELAAEIKDGWGFNYYVRMDYNLDGKLFHSGFEDMKDKQIKGKTVTMISNGSDGDRDGEDDVYSWK